MRLSRWAFVCLITAAVPSSAVAEPSAEAAAYLDSAISLIRQHHKDSLSADWARIATRARLDIATAITPDDTYGAIGRILRTLGERHSFLVEPDQARSGAKGPSGSEADAPMSRAPMPEWRMVQNRFALVRLPPLNTVGAGGGALGRAYTAALRQGLERMDGEDPCGWLVDLRGNGGGNMWPMLQGLDPLLGDPPFGYFVSRGEISSAWSRTRGEVLPASPAHAPDPASFVLDRSGAPVAVLIGRGTASSGELTALALIGRDGVRTFGAPTAGLTTGNSVHPLSDGALLVITSVTARDRTGKDYPGPITPEVKVADDQAEGAALDWLARACA